MYLSIIVPVFNEAKTIVEILKRLNRFQHSAVDYEIVVVNDGSSDGTLDLLNENSHLYSQLIHSEQNLGKGAAVIKGIKNAQGDYILIQDADLEYSPDDYEKLITPILEDRANIVFGSRIFKGDGKAPIGYRSARSLFSKLCSFFSGWKISDVAVCFKLLPKKLLVEAGLEESGFSIDPEIALKMASSPEAKFAEVPISYDPRSSEEGKKLRWWDGIPYLFAVLKYGVFCLYKRVFQKKS